MALLAAPTMLMVVLVFLLTGIENWIASFGSTDQARLMLGRIAIAAPYAIAAGSGIMFLFASKGGTAIRSAGAGVLIGSGFTIMIAAFRETTRLTAFIDAIPEGGTILHYADPATGVGTVIAAVTGAFAARVALRGNAAFATSTPRRVSGRRAIHGEASWMGLNDAKRLFPASGGIVLGEAYRVDKDTVADRGFRADDRETWGAGGKSGLLCFDASFGSTHGLVFAAPAASRPPASRSRRRSNGAAGWSRSIRPTRLRPW
jgi:type IV secretion system protein VirD4